MRIILIYKLNMCFVHIFFKAEAEVGAHAVLAVSYNDHSQRLIVMSSWGKNWGQQGYFTLPYDYLMQAKMAHDFWTLRR